MHASSKLTAATSAATVVFFLLLGVPFTPRLCTQLAHPVPFALVVHGFAVQCFLPALFGSGSLALVERGYVRFGASMRGRSFGCVEFGCCHALGKFLFGELRLCESVSDE
jgi:hypothetical protein